MGGPSLSGVANLTEHSFLEVDETDFCFGVFAIDNGWRTDDPTVRIKRFAEGEFHTWTDDEISQFENVWQVGTRERSVFALFLYTGQRASDVAKMSSSDIEGGGI